MLRLKDETTDHDTLHFAIEREWKRDQVQRDFWRDHGWGKFYIPPIGGLTATAIGPANMTHDDIGPQPCAFARYDRETGFIVVTTPLDTSYKWMIPLRFNPWGMIRTPLINPTNRGRY